ncbi:MAG: hemolysin family protein [Acidimicrobiales bacterium]
MDLLIPLALIAVMVSFNALYVAAEFATVGSRRSRVQEEAETGSSSAAGLLAILADPKRLDSYVAACQIGITLSSLVAGAYGQGALTPLLEPALGSAGGRAVAVLIVLVGITSVQVVLGELLPKTAALRYPETLAKATLRPMQVSQWLFRPLVTVFNGSAFALMRWRGLHVDASHAHVHSPEELAGLYRASAAGGLIDANEREMLAGVLNVEDRLVREIMTPRRRLTTVPATATATEALARLADSAHTRFPVTSGDDDIVGIVHLRDLFVATHEDPDQLVEHLARPVLAVIDVLTVPNLWRALREESQHCAIIVNEYGSVAGLVTLEDAIEEIFGELLDEFDLEEPPVTVDGRRVSVRGDVLLEVLEDRFDIHLTSDDVDTIGGLAWHVLGRRPVVGDEMTLELDGIVLRVDALDGTAVARASFDLPEEPT